MHKYAIVARSLDGLEIKSMVNLVLVKKGMLRYVRAVKGIGGGFSDYQVRLVGPWIKRREVVDGGSRIRSEKLREHRFREGYAGSLEVKRVEGWRK